MVLIESDHSDTCSLFWLRPPFTFLELRICGMSFWKRKKNMGLLIGNGTGFLGFVYFQRTGRDKNKSAANKGGAIIVHEAPGDLGEIT